MVLKSVVKDCPHHILPNITNTVFFSIYSLSKKFGYFVFVVSLSPLPCEELGPEEEVAWTPCFLVHSWINSCCRPPPLDPWIRRWSMVFCRRSLVSNQIYHRSTSFPSNQWYIACIVQVWSAAVGYKELTWELEAIRECEIFCII